MPTDQIIQHLTKHGERLDSEIALAVGIPLSIAHQHLKRLTANEKAMSAMSPGLYRVRKLRVSPVDWLGIYQKLHQAKNDVIFFSFDRLFFTT